MNRLPPFYMMTMAAPRGSGKSYLAKKMIARALSNDSFDFVMIMSPSLQLNQDYDDFIDDERVFRVSSNIQSSITQLIEDMERCKKRVIDVRRLKNRGEDEGDLPIGELECPRVLVVLDDIIDSSVVNFGGIVDTLAERGRHINIACIVMSQRISAVSRSIRINSDAFIVFSPFAVGETEQFIEQYVSRTLRKPIRREFRRIWEKKHEFILVDNKEHDPSQKIKHSNANAYVDRNKTWPVKIPEDAA